VIVMGKMTQFFQRVLDLLMSSHVTDWGTQFPISKFYIARFCRCPGDFHLDFRAY